ncbi:MAG: aminotransferase class I/II-fold pyridoxal phosphate-dependent enzyme, partial [Bacteroidales bacterium]|nr:aminotransferase class I/II-fold pyridoxal phosphate-dependent enzyme [Bacteroidales bacterium]
MYDKFQKYLVQQIEEIKISGTYKNERILISPQFSEIKINTGKEVLNFCANNYLGLANNKELVKAATNCLEERAYGMASVRFICGTSDLHKELETKIAHFFGTEDSILYAACFDANGGVFEPLLTENDAIISDAL